jgi:hypothetical protein
MDTTRDALTVDNLPDLVPRWREGGEAGLFAQMVRLIELAGSPHPADVYGSSDLLVMAAERAAELGLEAVAEEHFLRACDLQDDKVFSARGSMLRWTAETGFLADLELCEGWRRDQSCSVADHEELARFWMDQGEFRYAWGWAERGLMLAEECGLVRAQVRRLLHLRREILFCLDRDPLDPLDPDPHRSRSSRSRCSSAA